MVRGDGKIGHLDMRRYTGPPPVKEGMSAGEAFDLVLRAYLRQ